MDLQHTAPNPVLGDREASIKTQRQEGRKQNQIPTSIRGRQKDKGEWAGQSWLRNRGAENMEGPGFPVRPVICFHDR